MGDFNIDFFPFIEIRRLFVKACKETLNLQEQQVLWCCHDNICTCYRDKICTCDITMAPYVRAILYYEYDITHVHEWCYHGYICTWMMLPWLHMYLNNVTMTTYVHVFIYWYKALLSQLEADPKLVHQDIGLTPAKVCYNHPSIYLSIYPSIHLSIHSSIIHPSINPSIQ